MAHRKREEPIPTDRPYSRFAKYSDQELLGFVKDTVSLLKTCYCSIIYTITDNTIEQQATEDNLYRWHIQDLMQRTEYELQKDNGLAAIFLDPKDKDSDKAIRNAYASIYRDGDFIKKYLHITDSLSFLLSNQSFGIRVADFVAGIFNNFMREYPESTELFKNQVWPLVRKNPIDDPLGWGICEVPTNDNMRGKIRTRLVDIGLLPSIDKQSML